MEIQKGQRSPLAQILQNNVQSFQVELSISGVDVDFSCFGLNANGKLSDDRYMVFLNQPQSPYDAISLKSEMCSAIFSCDLNKLPTSIETLSFTAAIDGTETMQQIQSGHLKFFSGNQEAACFNFDGLDFNTEKTLILGDIYRKNGEWRFNAVAQGFQGGLENLVAYFGGKIETIEPVTTKEEKTMKFQGNIFAHITEQAKQIETHWAGVFQGILNVSSDYAHIDAEHLYTLNDKFKAALLHLNADLESPTLILATTGTTSSGKSTIVNLLCGADLMPRMAQEMSAGVVYINHSPDKKRKLKIHQTDGAFWECGEWHNLADDEIQIRLEKVMKSFNDSRGINQPATPHIELTYPIACFSNENFLKLTDVPLTTQFKIMDLPGLRNQQDNTNGKDIKNCRDALCLVAYNMEETDETRRLALVQQVLEQIKHMGGSPARMLFVLNRIDAFNKDRNREQNRSEHIDKIKAEIEGILYKELSEHRDALANLTYSPLSSLPALYSQRIKMGGEKIQAVSELEEHFKSLITNEVMKDMPRDLEQLSEHEFNRISEAVWQNSYGGEFFKDLENHIQAHFPTLVIPTIVQRFEKEVSDAIGEVARICYSEMNSSKEDYEKACELLHRQNAELCGFLDQAQQTLKNAFDNLLDDLKKNPGDKEDIFEFFAEDLLKTEIYRGRITSSKLNPLYSCFTNLRSSAEDVIHAMKQTLDSPNNRNFSSTFVEQLPERLQQKLESACTDYKTARKKDNEKDFEKQLNNFFYELNLVVNEVITMKSDVENNRIYDAVELLMKHYLNYLQEGVEKRASQWNLSIGHHVLKELTKPAIKTIRLTGDVENTGKTEKRWYTIWIANHSLAQLPKPSTLHKANLAELDKQIASLVELFHIMMRDYLLQLNNKISAEQAKVMKDFEAKLAQANAKHHENYDNVLRCWEPLNQQSEQLSDLLKQLVKVGKSA
jgi:stress response protein SCP2/GTPase Era involved in 16S rRNA processing